MAFLTKLQCFGKRIEPKIIGLEFLLHKAACPSLKKILWVPLLTNGLQINDNTNFSTLQLQ